jgi:hypothetical protein
MGPQTEMTLTMAQRCWARRTFYEPQTQEFFPVGGHHRGDWDEQAFDLIRR